MKIFYSFFKPSIVAALLIISLSINSLRAQDYHVSFAGHGVGNTVDSVIVENLTQRTYLTMKGNAVLHLMAETSGIRKTGVNNENSVRFSPNPMNDFTVMQFSLKEQGQAKISIYDPSGRLLKNQENILKEGVHKYRISGVPAGLYFVTVQTGNEIITGKLLCNNTENHNVCIVHENTIPIQKIDSYNKSSKSYVEMQYNSGDRLKCTGIGGAVAISSAVYKSDTTITFDFYPCTDSDGNKYATVKIGTQIWMAENLKTTKYNDGSDIPYVSDSLQWGFRDPAYCWFKNNESAYKNLLGGDYNWYAVNTYMLCPKGWHVPSRMEWQTMEDYLVSNGYNYDNSTSGNKLGKAVATPFMPFIYLAPCTLTNWWFNDNGEGSVGNLDYYTKFNSSGFSAIPTGLAGVAQFGVVGNTACFWSSTESNGQQAYIRHVNYNWEWFSQGLSDKAGGLSVRCLKD